MGYVGNQNAGTSIVGPVVGGVGGGGGNIHFLVSFFQVGLCIILAIVAVLVFRRKPKKEAAHEEAMIMDETQKGGGSPPSLGPSPSITSPPGASGLFDGEMEELQDIVIINKLGEGIFFSCRIGRSVGSFGAVYLGDWQSGTNVALKKLIGSKNDVDEFKKEATMLR